MIAETLPPVLEEVISGAESVLQAEQLEAPDERRGAPGRARATARDSDDALYEALQHDREANELFGRIEGWSITARSAPLISALQEIGIDFRMGIYARTSAERVRAMRHLIQKAKDAIRACRNYRVSTQIVDT